ncbi:MAG: gamma-glutamyltransferase [Bacteroidota bacterium]
MVVTAHPEASKIGLEILRKGGHAVDAAVAVQFALAVSFPYAGNIGGGGFMLIHDADSDTQYSIDYRERAPIGASRDMYLDENGDVDSNRSRYSHLSSGVPGTVRGFWLAHQKGGRLPWKRLLQPAIEQARNGIVVSFDLSTMLKLRHEYLCRTEAACQYFYKEGGVPYEPGELLVQSDLANSLELIAELGPDAFYKGPIAKLITAEMQRGGGLVDKASLENYEPAIRGVVRGNYRGHEVVTMPPPSSGGIHVVQMLNILEHFDVAEMGVGSADSVHLLAEAMRLAYADRSKHLGDPDFWEVPSAWLTSKDYGRELAASISMELARDSEEVAPGVAPAHESEDTTHYSVIDADGNVVSNTYTLNFSYGSGIAVEGAGFLLNNEMDDFSSKPGVPNAFGLLGGEANAIEAGKRPLSSMTPTIVFAEDGEPWFATGSPGGSRIITSVLQVIVNSIDHDMNLAMAGASPRIHHQWFPDVLLMEQGFSPDTVDLLEERGHNIEQRAAMGSIQSVGIRDGVFRGASDTRRPNAGSATPRPGVQQ